MDCTSTSSNVWDLYDKCIEETQKETCLEEIVHGFPTHCPKCMSYTVCDDPVSGSIVCTSCGNVLEFGVMDESAEWNMCSDNSNRRQVDPVRCGTPINPLLQKSSLSTMINSRNPKHMFMQKIHNQMSMNYMERSRYHIFQEIQKMGSDQGHLSPVVIEQAKYYYKELSHRKLSRGIIRKGLIACCLMYACKSMNVPRSIKEISDMTGVSVPVINKTTKIFIDNMNDILLKSERDSDAKGKGPLRKCDYVYEATDSSDLITRYCYLLHLEKHQKTKLIKQCRNMNDELREVQLLDCKTPNAIASGIIMFQCQEMNFRDVTKQKVGKLFSVSVVTVNKIIKIIQDYISSK